MLSGFPMRLGEQGQKMMPAQYGTPSPPRVQALFYAGNPRFGPAELSGAPTQQHLAQRPHRGDAVLFRDCEGLFHVVSNHPCFSPEAMDVGPSRQDVRQARGMRSRPRPLDPPYGPFRISEKPGHVGRMDPAHETFVLGLKNGLGARPLAIAQSHTFFEVWQCLAKLAHVGLGDPDRSVKRARPRCRSRERGWKRLRGVR